MGFNRQLDALMAVLAALIVFVGCVFSGALTVTQSLLIAAAVFLAGLVFGRRVAEIVTSIF
jgi:hypothetical protein